MDIKGDEITKISRFEEHNSVPIGVSRLWEFPLRHF
jgi:hypothetical protein